MAGRIKHYRIERSVSGSFVGSHGRIRYALEPGLFSEKDIDPEVLARLIATGKARKASKPAQSKERP